MIPSSSAVVSVVLVNFRGADDTITAIEELGKLDWPQDRLEIVVVENASGDDSAERIRAAAPHVRLIESSSNDGFAGGCNRGVAASTGEIIALLNNDARPDREWISAAVARFRTSPEIGGVASRVLDWEGERVDYIDAGMTWYGMGYKPLTGDPVPKREPGVHDVLFGTGSAMFIRRDVYDALGGFDERYFMFFEDVDLGWRLNLAGWRFVYEPASTAYHKHHASMSKFGSHKETVLLERNALYTLYKNIGDESVGEALPGAMALSIRRGMTRAGLDSNAYDLRRPGDDGETEPEVSKQAMAAMFAIDQFVDALPSLRESRERIQRERAVPESRIWSLFGLVDAPIIHEEPYTSGYEAIVTALDVTEPPVSSRVLIITGDPIGAKLAGPAIRAWNMAALLSKRHEVTLVSLTGVEAVDAPFRVVHVAPGDDRALAAIEREIDVVVFQGHALDLFETLRTTQKPIVVDIYDPMHLEQLEQARELPRAQWDDAVAGATESLNEQLLRGDFFLCASERQRPFWLGQLAGLGRINPGTYEHDPHLRGLIDVASFGLSSTPPQHRRPALKGVVPGIGEHDKVILWSGGLYNWFDPETLIRAVAALSQRHDDVRLFFMGTKHPHPGVPEMEIVARSRTLAAELGVLDRSVFFNDSWVDFADRENYLLEADAGVSTHFAHLETTFSFRTRILDYLWAGLPMVVTAGDHFADLVRAEGLGVAVPAQQVDALVEALELVLYDADAAERARAAIAGVREQYEWERTLAPLVRFVDAPHRAGDRGDGRASLARPRRRVRRSGLRHDIDLVIRHLRMGGVSLVIQKVKGRLARRSS